MRSFDYRWLGECLWDGEVVSLLSQIHEYKGRQDLFVSQRSGLVVWRGLWRLRRCRVWSRRTGLKGL